MEKNKEIKKDKENKTKKSKKMAYKKKKITKSQKKQINRQKMPKVERSEFEIKKLQSKLNRVVGQLNGVKRMVEEGRVSEDILIQLSAVSSVIESIKFSLYKEFFLNDEKNDFKSLSESSIDDILAIIRKY